MVKVEKIVYKDFEGKDLYNPLGSNSNFGASITFVLTYKGQIVYSMPNHIAVNPFFNFPLFNSLDELDETLAITRKIKRGNPSVFRFYFSHAYGYIQMNSLYDQHFLKLLNSFNNLANVGVILGNDRLLERFKWLYVEVYETVSRLAFVSAEKVNCFLDEVLRVNKQLFKNYCDVSFVDHVKPKYYIPLERYFTDEDIILLKQLIKKTYPTFPRIGNLLATYDEVPQFYGSTRYFPDVSGKVSYKGAPYGFDDVPIEEYKEYLLDIYGPEKFNYSNFGPPFLEDYKTIEDLVNVENALRPEQYYLDSALASVSYYKRSDYKYHVLRTLFWKGVCSIKI